MGWEKSKKTLDHSLIKSGKHCFNPRKPARGENMFLGPDVYSGQSLPPQILHRNHGSWDSLPGHGSLSCETKCTLWLGTWSGSRSSLCGSIRNHDQQPCSVRTAIYWSFDRLSKTCGQRESRQDRHKREQCSNFILYPQKHPKCQT